MIKSTTEIKVRYAETDKMGVVYHSNYLIWMEAGRIQMLEEVGCPYDKLEEQGYMLPVIEANIIYKLPARFNDLILVCSSIKTKPKSRILITYELFREKEILCQGHTLHAFVKTNGKPSRPPRHFIEKITPLFDEK